MAKAENKYNVPIGNYSEESIYRQGQVLKNVN